MSRSKNTPDKISRVGSVGSAVSQNILTFLSVNFIFVNKWSTIVMMIKRNRTRQRKAWLRFPSSNARISLLVVVQRCWCCFYKSAASVSRFFVMVNSMSYVAGRSVSTHDYCYLISFNRVWRHVGHGPVLMSLTASIWRCCQWLHSRSLPFKWVWSPHFWCL